LRFSKLSANLSSTGLNVVLLDVSGNPYRVYQADNGVWYWGGALPNPQNLSFDMLATGTDESDNNSTLSL